MKERVVQEVVQFDCTNNIAQKNQKWEKLF
jgi:hypothetical protein